MPTTLMPEPPIPDQFPSRKRFTRDEVKFLVDNNLLTERWELIDGEIILVMAQNPPHNSTLLLIAIWLEQVFGRLFVRTQQAVEVAIKERKRNYPEPDISVLTKPLHEFYSRHPNPDEAVLLVEIADTTLTSDQCEKRDLYARAGVGEYWVADVKNRQIFVYRDPTSNGYTAVSMYTAEEEIATLARPDAKIRVNDLFPPDVS